MLKSIYNLAKALAPEQGTDVEVDGGSLWIYATRQNKVAVWATDEDGEPVGGFLLRQGQLVQLLAALTHEGAKAGMGQS